METVLVVFTVFTLMSIAKADVRVGNLAVNRTKTDEWTSGLYIIDPRLGVRYDGPIKSWSVFVAKRGVFAFLILEKDPKDSKRYKIKYSEKKVFTYWDEKKVYTRTCKDPCFAIKKSDFLGFYFGSAGMIPYSLQRSCASGGYFSYAKQSKKYNYGVGASHTFLTAHYSWGRCRVYSIGATLSVFNMYELSRTGLYSIRDRTFGYIYSQLASNYPIMRNSEIRIVAPQSRMRIRLGFVGPVRLSYLGRRPEPSTCNTGWPKPDWLEIYEYHNGYRKLLLPRICGKWEYGLNKIAVLPDVYSSTSEIYIRFFTYDHRPNSGFIISFRTFLPTDTKTPVYLKAACAEENPLQISMSRSTTSSSRSVQATQSYPRTQAHRSTGPLGSMDCTIDIRGRSGIEEFGLVFTWFQLPDQSGSCGRKPPYLKVYAKTKSRPTSYRLKDTLCGARDSAILLTRSSNLRVVIKGNIGNGFAFDIYTSHEYLQKTYGKIANSTTTEVDKGFNSAPLGFLSILFVAMFVWYMRYKRTQNRNPCTNVCTNIGSMCHSVGFCLRNLIRSETRRPEAVSVNTTVQSSERNAATQVAPPTGEPAYTQPVVSAGSGTIPQELSAPPLYESLERLPTPTHQQGTVQDSSDLPPAYDVAVNMPNYRLPETNSSIDSRINSQC